MKHKKRGLALLLMLTLALLCGCTGQMLPAGKANLRFITVVRMHRMTKAM